MISIVIPSFNEESTLKEAVMTSATELAKYSPDNWEIIIVDDGSQDRTFLVAQQMTLNPRIRLFRHDINRGKGAAVRTGVLQTRGDAVLVMDADLSTHPAMLESFFPELTDSVALVIGNRRATESQIEKKQTLLRYYMGGVYAAMARFVTGASLRDFNCGFKLINGDVARSLLAQCRSDRWVWDVEVIALALRHGFRVKALPVTWRQGSHTSVRPLRDSLISLFELMKLWGRLSRLKKNLVKLEHTNHA
jgi:dolichyl-phosphate beta-glucosyltransferase